MTVDDVLKEDSREGCSFDGECKPYLAKRELDKVFLASIVLYQMFRPVNYLIGKIKSGVYKSAPCEGTIGGGAHMEM